MPKYQTDFMYDSRETKAEFVWRKYRPALAGKRILDVGADQGYLRRHIDASTSYYGVGFGDAVDELLDLEINGLPYADETYDTVLCLDVLEHIENIHAVFDDLCRVAREYVIISLPNPWRELYDALRYGDYNAERHLKFYGLPLEKPDDRHKWFFSAEEAERFIHYRAGKNNMHIEQLEYVMNSNEGKGRVAWLRRLARSILFRDDLNAANLYQGTLWVILTKRG